MRTLLVYESMFGNTRLVAQAIAEGLAPYGEVTLCEVGAAPTPLPTDVDLLVVGAPTHAFGMSRPQTRGQAATQAMQPLVSSGHGVREWLDGLAAGIHQIPAAGFDTKLGKPSWLPGSAARAIAQRLRRLGHARAAMPRSFYVAGVAGPLVDGELDRAWQWGSQLGQTLATQLSPTS